MLMEHAGVPISIVSKWAGHYDAAFTQRTYVHARDPTWSKATEPSPAFTRSPLPTDKSLTFLPSPSTGADPLRVGDRPLHSLTKADIEDLVDWMLASGRRRGRKARYGPVRSHRSSSLGAAPASS
jgi:hypothetical protein